MSKMRFIAELNGNEHVVEVDNHGLDDGCYTMNLDGRQYEVEAQLMKSLLVSMLIDNHSYDVDVEKASIEPLDGRLSVRVRGRVVKFEMLDERRKKMKEAQAGRLDHGGAALVSSPMPGKVMKLLVAEGDEITEGQGVVVVEAMKMENELKSPIAGIVKSIKAHEGDAVESGAALVLIEHEGEDD
jgi:biotin carboxyl carrier protein